MFACLKRMVPAMLALCLLLGACAPLQEISVDAVDGEETARAIVPATSSIEEETLEGHRLIAKNETYSLFLKEETLSIILREDASGRLMRSAVETPHEEDQRAWSNFTQSGVAIEYYVGSATTAQRADMLTKDPKKTVTRTETGFAAQIHYDGLSIRFTVFVDLTENGIVAEVPQASIEDPGKSKLAAIYLYPFFGYSFRGERDGYMLIPDGSGALISLEDHDGKYVQPYTARVYGEDYGVKQPYKVMQSFDAIASTYLPVRNATVPVFGMVHTDAQFGFLGVIEKGQYNAEIVAYPNGALTQYNWITAKFLYRQTFVYPTTRTSGILTVQKERGTFDMRVRYLFVSGEEADYTGLACAYREHLRKNGTLGGTAADAAPLQVDFFAGDVQESALGYSFCPTTTLEQLQAMCRELNEGGVDSMLAVYKGWQPEGIYGALDDDVRPDGALGSRKELGETAAALKALGVTLKLYADPVTAYQDDAYAADSYLYGIYERMLKLNAQLELHEYIYRYTPARTLTLMQGLRADAATSGVGMAFGGIGNTLTTSMIDDVTVSRQQTAQLYAGALNGGETLYAPGDFLWSKTAAYLDFPMETSNYQFVSEEVPFFAIALSGSMRLYGGYLNFQTDRETYLLDMIAAGVYPSFLLMKEDASTLLYTDSRQLFACGYDVYKQDVIECYDIFAALARATGDGAITAYRREGEISVTVYANGCTVYVNRADTAATVDGVEIGANSYCIEEGAA